jgi:phosphoglycolate phosphatase-like HAD superfamily hydrolase
VEAALKKLGLPPEEVLMLGDSRYDVESATRAGVRTVGVRCGGSTDQELAGAIAVYNDPADIVAHFDASPFAGGEG